MSKPLKFAIFLLFCILSSTRDSFSELLFKGDETKINPYFLLFIFSIVTQTTALLGTLALSSEREGITKAFNRGRYREVIALNFFTLIAFLLYFLAIASPIGAATNSLIDYGTSPIFTAIVGSILLGRDLSKGFLIGSLVCMSGVALIYLTSINNEIYSISNTHTTLGLLYALGSSASSAMYRIYFKKLLNDGISKSLIVFTRLLGISTVLGFYIFFHPYLWISDMIIQASLVGLFSFTIPLFISLFVLQRVSIENFSMLLFLLPAFTTIESTLLGYYDMSLTKIYGVILLLAGMYIFEQKKETDRNN
jgi:drug/metabolite transporter (DMT)-like permease